MQRRQRVVGVLHTHFHRGVGFFGAFRRAGDGHGDGATRRRQRVLKALDTAVTNREEITVSGIARTAGVNRSFFYRHRDLLERIHAAAATPPPAEGQASVTRASLQADLANALQRNTRLTARVRQLERRLSEQLGVHAWHDSVLGAPFGIVRLQQQIDALEQHVVELQGQLDERTSELDAA
ncbi:DUF6262 family protein [Saccharopolyspora shandongensis]|uniref:DUF6262 family protein n=1 Tax=Saccharopolyspora shandongensis TaxID=418495 RepID=UPI0033F20823